MLTTTRQFIRRISTMPKPDAISGLKEIFNKDTNKNKVDLIIGEFINNSGTTSVPDLIKAHLVEIEKMRQLTQNKRKLMMKSVIYI